MDATEQEINYSEELEAQRNQQIAVQQMEEAQETEEEVQINFALETQANQILGYMDELREEGESYRHPSRVKYLVLSIIAIAADAIGILCYLISTGSIVLPPAAAFIIPALTIIAVIISGIATVIIATTLWLTDSQYKNAAKYANKLKSELPEILANIEAITVKMGQLTVRTGRLLQKSAMFAKIGAKIAESGAKIIVIVKNPVIRSGILGFIDTIAPYLNMAPLITIGVFWSYWAESRTYKHARNASATTFGSETLQYANLALSAVNGQTTNATTTSYPRAETTARISGSLSNQGGLNNSALKQPGIDSALRVGRTEEQILEARNSKRSKFFDLSVEEGMAFREKNFQEMQKKHGTEFASKWSYSDNVAADWEQEQVRLKREEERKYFDERQKNHEESLNNNSN
jgi:hypothetical protein